MTRLDKLRAGRGVRRMSALLGVLCVLGGEMLFSGPLHAQGYHNPVLERPQGVADPFILKWNGEYYLYATGDPIMAYHSKDLVHWDEIGPVLSSSKAPDAWNQTDVWAPEVVYRNGKFYLYYSASRASSDWRVGEYARRVGVGVSDSPRGPFVDSGHPVTPYWTIDGDVFRDPDGPNAGSEYLFASYLDEARWHGAGITADRLVAPDRAANQPSKVTQGSEYWEDKDADPNNGSLRYTNEGPTVFKRLGRYYMFYSGGSWDLPTYAMAYAWSDSLPAGGVNGPGWTKVVPPILRSTPVVDAPGHNTLTFAPNNVDYITGYHARVVPFTGPGDRQTFIDRVYWNGWRPFMDQPTTGTLASPDMPLFRDLFDRADGPVGDAWEASGSWRVSGGALRGRGRAAPRAPRLSDYVFEANVRPGGGGAGVVAWSLGRGDEVTVLLRPDLRALVSAGSVAGRALQTQTTKLPDDFRFDAWHQLLVTRNGRELRVALDGVQAQRIAVAPGQAGVALLAGPGEGAFDGIALTAHYEDTFDGAAIPAGWTTTGGTWRVQGGAFRQDAAGPGLQLALKGDTADAYELSASARLLAGDSASQVGVVAADDGRRRILAGFDHTIWPFARFHVRSVAAGASSPEQELQVEMPRGFLYDQYHTLRVLKQGSAFTFWLDGAEIAAARFPMGPARPGIFTAGARAEFDDVAMTRVVTPRNLVLDGSFEAERWEPRGGAPELPWRLEGKAQVSQCCGHSGVRRLLLTGDDGRATQVVTGLQPGRYTLEAWLIARGGAGTVEVTPAGGQAQHATSASEAWHRASVDFEVPAGQTTATITIRGELRAPDALVAADDVYLYRR